MVQQYTDLQLSQTFSDKIGHLCTIHQYGQEEYRVTLSGDSDFSLAWNVLICQSCRNQDKIRNGNPWGHPLRLQYSAPIRPPDVSSCFHAHASTAIFSFNFHPQTVLDNRSSAIHTYLHLKSLANVNTCHFRYFKNVLSLQRCLEFPHLSEKWRAPPFPRLNRGEKCDVWLQCLENHEISGWIQAVLYADNTGRGESDWLQEVRINGRPSFVPSIGFPPPLPLIYFLQYIQTYSFRTFNRGAYSQSISSHSTWLQ